MTNAGLIDELIADGVLKTPSIIETFRSIDRVDFVPEKLRDEAYVNAPLPIGYGQTISQPLTVAFMLELLQPQAGDNILDIGSGSGWQTALLAHIVGKGGGGHVTALEVIPELHAQSVKNVSKYNFLEKGIVEMHCMNALTGFPNNAPFDGIIAAASAREVPQAWKDQLKVGGRIVAPIGSSVYQLTKNQDGSVDEREYPGFAFVPFVEE